MSLKEALKEKTQQQTIQATVNGVDSPKPTTEQTFRAELKKMESEIIRALPKHMSIDRFCRIVATEIRRNPKLLQVVQDAPITLWSAILLAAQLGLDLTPSLGQGYIIPYYNGKTQKTEAQFQVGYRGLVDLVRRSGEIESIMCEVVYENDSLDMKLGPDMVFEHKPYLDGEPGKPRLFYVIAKFRSGGFHLEWMTLSQIEKIRARSKSGDSGPWKTDYEEMAKKTVIKRACKKLPLSTDIQRLVAQDEVVKRDITDDLISYQDDEQIINLDKEENKN